MKRKNFFEDLMPTKRRKCEANNSISELPVELQQHCLAMLHPLTVCLKIPLVCKSWRDLSRFLLANFPAGHFSRAIASLERTKKSAQRQLAYLNEATLVREPAMAALFSAASILAFPISLAVGGLLLKDTFDRNQSLAEVFRSLPGRAKEGVTCAIDIAKLGISANRDFIGKIAEYSQRRAELIKKINYLEHL